MQSRKRFFPSSLAPLRSIHGTLVRRFGTPTTTQLGIFLNPSQRFRCLAFCTLYRLSYPQHSVHHLLHPLILTAANPESILDELARARERLNVDSTSVFDALIKAYCELKMPDEALKSFYLIKEKGFLPQIETCNQMLKLFLKLNRNHAKEFIGHMKTIGEMVSHALAYDALIHNCCKIGVVECYRKQNTEDLLRSTTALPFRHLELGRLPAPTGVASLLGRQGRSSSLCLPRKFSTSRDEEKENEERYGKKFPNSLNWRSITGVKLKDQGSIESHSNACAAYSISTILEIYHKLQTGKSAELSVDRFAEENPDGAKLFDVLHFAAQHGFEYTKSPVNSGNGRVLRVKSYKASFVRPGNRILTLTNPRTIVGCQTRSDRAEIAIEPDDDWLFQLVSKHAVAVSLCLPNDKVCAYREGIFEAEYPSQTERVHHAMALIGYEGHCWRLQNSYGTALGSDGDILMSRNTLMKLMEFVAYPTAELIYI